MSDLGPLVPITDEQAKLGREALKALQRVPKKREAARVRRANNVSPPRSGQLRILGVIL